MIPGTAFASVRPRKAKRTAILSGAGFSGRQSQAPNTASSSSNSRSGRSQNLQDKPDFGYGSHNDVAQEFLDSLRSLTTRDFEHAAAAPETYGGRRDAQPPNNESIVIVERPKTRKGRQDATVNLEGFQFFIPAPQKQNHTRPSTVPRAVKNLNGDGPSGIKHEAKRREAESLASSRGRALIRSKVTPSQIETVSSTSRKPPSLAISRSSSDSSLQTSDSEQTRPLSASSSKRVTFAADTVNYERENKPTRRRKLSKRRKQGFPHPSRGIFVPPDLEIVESSGPGGSCRANPYLNFNQVWTHPAARGTGESSASKLIRTERFHRLMTDLERAHVQYNRLASGDQNEYLIQCIFKRYVLVLDLALTEGHIAQVEHLLETVSKSIPVLHQNVFYYLYGPKIVKDSDENNNIQSRPQETTSCYHPDLVLTSYALTRISGDLPRQDVTKMSIETVLVKICLEIIQVVYSPYGSLMFRDALNTLPYSVRQAILLLKNIRSSKDAFCYIKWINNSAVQRDFRSILKNLGLLDRYGCKADVPGADKLENSLKQQHRHKSSTAGANNDSGSGNIKRGNKGHHHSSGRVLTS